MIIPEEEASCFALIEDLRYPTGFECDQCGARRPPRRIRTRLTVLRCATCGAETSLLSGTIFERSRLPICDWLSSLKLFAGAKDGMTVRELQEALDLERYETAYKALHRLRLATAEVEPSPLGEMGTVVIEFLDNFSQPVVAALDIDEDRLRLRDLSGYSANDLETFMEDFVAANAVIATTDEVILDAGRSMGHTVVNPGREEELRFDKLEQNVQRWFSRRAQRSATRHLRPLLNEYAFRRTFADREVEALEALLENAVLRAAPEGGRLYSRQWLHPNGRRI